MLQVQQNLAAVMRLMSQRVGDEHVDTAPGAFDLARLFGFGDESPISFPEASSAERRESFVHAPLSSLGALLIRAGDWTSSHIRRTLWRCAI